MADPLTVQEVLRRRLTVHNILEKPDDCGIHQREIYTVDPCGPWAETVLVEDGVFTAVGSGLKFRHQALGQETRQSDSKKS